MGHFLELVCTKLSQTFEKRLASVGAFGLTSSKPLGSAIKLPVCDFSLKTFRYYFVKQLFCFIRLSKFLEWIVKDSRLDGTFVMKMTYFRLIFRKDISPDMAVATASNEVCISLEKIIFLEFFNFSRQCLVINHGPTHFR